MLYKEFTRLNTLIDVYATGSFADFKMLGAIGAMLAWEPLAKRVIKVESQSKEGFPPNYSDAVLAKQ